MPPRVRAPDRAGADGRRAVDAELWPLSEDRPTSAYPEIHHLTARLRAHGRSTKEADLVNLSAVGITELARECGEIEAPR